MPVKLHEFIHADHGGDDIAGYLESATGSPGEPRRFVHWRSSNAMLPAFVNCLEDGGDMQRVYTNHEASPWARPRGPGVKRRDNLRADDGDGRLLVEPVEMTTRRWPVRVTGTAGPAPLIGGLHAAARSAVADAGAGADASAVSDDGDAPNLRRALGRYALATRTLIAHSAASGFRGVHDHVGAILVGDDGAILAAGINSGSYRHAEVSLLLSWFRDHPEARALPAKSIVFSTLTPCRQCTRYLSLAKSSDTVILFDEADAGRSGRVGERIAGRFDIGLDGEAGTATSSIDSPAGMPVDETTMPVRTVDTASGTTPSLVNVTREAERRAIRNDSDGGTSRTDRAREARRLILDAAGATDRASGCTAERGHGKSDGGCRIDIAVSAFLAEWILEAARVE